MNEMFPFVGAEHVSLARCGRSFDEGLRQRGGDAETAEAEEEAIDDSRSNEFMAIRSDVSIVFRPRCMG